LHEVGRGGAVLDALSDRAQLSSAWAICKVDATIILLRGSLRMVEMKERSIFSSCTGRSRR
jgi:hypothetical protein